MSSWRKFLFVIYFLFPPLFFRVLSESMQSTYVKCVQCNNKSDILVSNVAVALQSSDSWRKGKTLLQTGPPSVGVFMQYMTQTPLVPKKHKRDGASFSSAPCHPFQPLQYRCLHECRTHHLMECNDCMMPRRSGKRPSEKDQDTKDEKAGSILVPCYSVFPERTHLNEPTVVAVVVLPPTQNFKKERSRAHRRQQRQRKWAKSAEKKKVADLHLNRAIDTSNWRDKPKVND